MLLERFSDIRVSIDSILTRTEVVMYVLSKFIEEGNSLFALLRR